MRKTVVKIGGSNLKTNDDISGIIKAIGYYKSPIIIVVSALYGVTNTLEKALNRAKSSKDSIKDVVELLNAAHCHVLNNFIDNFRVKDRIALNMNRRLNELERYLQGVNYLGEIPGFANDMILSYGERLMSQMFEAILNYNGIQCEERLPEQIGLRVIGDYGNAEIDFAACENKINKTLFGRQTYIIPGFYGISADSKVMLLGRGGSDYSAAAIARCVRALSLDIWKDVPGFLSADPQIVKSPVNLKRLSYREAAELSYFGARILHPRTVEPLSDRNIPIRILNSQSFNKTLKPFTVIDNKSIIKKNIIKSVTYTNDIAILKLIGPGVGIQPGIIAKVAAELNHARINIKSIITAQTSINILLGKNDLDKSLSITKALALSSVKNIVCLNDISIVAVVGEGMIDRPGIAAKIFKAVSKYKINVGIVSAGASEVAIYFIINKKDTSKAIKAIHEEYFK